MTKHKTLAFFIPHIGCPHRCSFCDQRTITGNIHAPTPDEVVDTCREMLSRYGTLDDAEIAFFGGSFTAVDPAYQTALLQSVQPFLGKGKFAGIRISTRPDAIDDAILDKLKYYHVTAVELGAQSMSDHVLAANGRGHTAWDVRIAAKKIRVAKISLGLQQMVGLYGSTLFDEYDTLKQLLQCKPESMRIYPTVILEGTKLAEYCRSGNYPTLPQEAVLEFCADALCLCAQEKVHVIRMGLHDSPSIRERMIAGYYHPAYRELVESRLYRRALERAAAACNGSELCVQTAPRTTSKVLGQHGCNRTWLAQRGVTLRVTETPEVLPYEITVGKNVYDLISLGVKHAEKAV